MHGSNPLVKVLEVSAQVWLFLNVFQWLEGENGAAHHRVSKGLAILDNLDRSAAN